MFTVHKLTLYINWHSIVYIVYLVELVYPFWDYKRPPPVITFFRRKLVFEFKNCFFNPWVHCLLCLCLAYRDNIDRGGDRLAALLPRIHNQMQRDLSRDNRIGTKCNHISIIKDWLIFCAKTGLDPFSLNPIPKCIIYWLYDRTNRMVKGGFWFRISDFNTSNV